jgi:Tfp pilus assembly protein PilN
MAVSPRSSDAGTKDMLDIDFLPQEMQRRQARRDSSLRPVLVGAAIIAIVGAAAIVQHRQTREARQALAAVEPFYEQAVAQQQQLVETKKQVEKLRHEAELYTYLKHPWPRTQLLAAVLLPLPAAVRLEQLQVVREAASPSGQPETRARGDRPSDEEQAKLMPVQRDLRRLREEYDKTQAVVRLSGSTSDSAALHQYLAELGRNGLFVRAELDAIESLEVKGVPTARFRATLFVRPGYGQPGARATPATLARTNLVPPSTP